MEQMVKVVVTASNGNTMEYKTKGNFDIPFNALAQSIKDSTYFFSKKNLDYIKTNLVPIGVTAYDARIFIIGGRNSQVITTKVDGRNKAIKTLPYLHWDDVYQFIMDNSTQEDIKDYFNRQELRDRTYTYYKK